MNELQYVVVIFLHTGLMVVVIFVIFVVVVVIFVVVIFVVVVVVLVMAVVTKRFRVTVIVVLTDINSHMAPFWIEAAAQYPELHTHLLLTHAAFNSLQSSSSPPKHPTSVVWPHTVVVVVVVVVLFVPSKHLSEHAPHFPMYLPLASVSVAQKREVVHG